MRLLRQKANSSAAGLSEVDEMAVAGIVSTQLLYHHFIAELVPSLGSDKIRLSNETGTAKGPIINTLTNRSLSIPVKSSDQG